MGGKRSTSISSMELFKLNGWNVRVKRAPKRRPLQINHAAGFALACLCAT